MHLRAMGDDLQRLALGAHLDEGTLEAEDAQEVDEVTLDEAQRAQVIELVPGEAQPAQRIELGVDLRQQLGQRKLGRAAADKFVARLGLRMAVQHGLPHREFVEIGVEQAGNDGGHGGSVGKGQSVAGGELHALGAHRGQEILLRGLEAGDRPHAVGQQHHAPRMTGGQVVDKMLDGGAYAVAAGFARDDQQVGPCQAREQAGVERRAGIGRIDDFRHQRTVVFGKRIHALEHLLHGLLLL
ncbi:hypothetical protein D3C71_1524230 [compost metagenome]